MKQIQDYYFKKAKKEGYPARSVYKLEEAQLKYKLLHKGDSVLDLGCQPGSWSMYAAKIVGAGGMVVGVDLGSGTIHLHGNSAQTRFLVSDIMANETIALITKIKPHFQVLLSDIAPNTTGNKWADQQHSLTLARRVFELTRYLLVNGGNFYVKVFEGEDFKEFVDNVRQHFTMTKIIKPKSSRRQSREVFVLGMGFTAHILKKGSTYDDSC